MITALVGLSLAALAAGIFLLPHSSYSVGLLAAGILLAILARMLQSEWHRDLAARQHEEVMEVLRKTYAAGQVPAPLPTEDSVAGVKAEDFKL
jgi:hypothetical protein